MNIRKLSVTQGVVWVREAINVGVRNPRAIFGAAALFVGALYSLAALAVMPVAVQLQGRSDISMREAVGVAIPLFLVLTLAMPILLAGLMHVVREAEAGRPVRARDVFSALARGRGWQLALLGLVQLALSAAGAVLVIALAGSHYWPEYFKAVSDAMAGHVGTPPQPDHPLLMFLVQLVFNYFNYALMLLCIPLIAFSKLDLVDSVRLALRAAVTNAGTFVVAALLFFSGLIVAAVVVGVVVLVVGGLATLISPFLGAALTLVVYGAFAVAVLVVLAAVSHGAWRDTFGEAGNNGGTRTAPLTPATAPMQIEA